MPYTLNQYHKYFNLALTLSVLCWYITVSKSPIMCFPPSSRSHLMMDQMTTQACIVCDKLSNSTIRTTEYRLMSF